jgi:hypothetical protein
MTEKADIEMIDAEKIHPLQTKFDEAEDLVATMTETSSPDGAIKSFQIILAYGKFLYCLFNKLYVFPNQTNYIQLMMIAPLK